MTLLLYGKAQIHEESAFDISGIKLLSEFERVFNEMA